MNKFDEPLSDDARVLDLYLNQYKDCIHRKYELEKRRKDIIQEFDHPLSAVSYDGQPHGSGEGTGCAALAYRLDEIDTRIRDQAMRATKALVEIMDVIEFLPENSRERAIIEARYIDRSGWQRICKTHHLTRTPATRYWKRGLKKLLEFKKVRKILTDFKQQQEL